MKKITAKDFEALKQWQDEGRRAVKIDMDCLNVEPIKVFVYDYEMSNGRYIENVSELPTIEDMKEEKIKELEEKIAQLKGEMK